VATYSVGYGWICKPCNTTSFVLVTSQDIAIDDAVEHADAKHGGDLTGLTIVAESFEDEDEDDLYEDDDWDID